jgi:glucan biosynthesis protein C
MRHDYNNVWTSTEPQAMKLGANVANAESERVQAARGVACVLLVAFHVIGSQDASGLQVAPDSGYRIFANLLTHVRMPLFTFLSGFVYAYRPVGRAELGPFALKKLRRLYLPMIFAATVFFFGHMLARDGVPPTRIAEIWRIYVLSYEHFWFLQGLMIVFALSLLLESLRALATFSRYLVALIGSLLLFFYEPLEGIALFSFSQAVYLLPFFLLGIGANRFREFFFSPAMLVATIAAFLAGLGVQAQDVLELHGDTQERRSMLALTIGFSATLLAIRWLPRPRLLTQIGGYSFVIYLYHPLFAAAVRIAAGSSEALPLSAVFWAGLAAGIAGPIAIELLARRYRVSRILVLGQR